MKLFCRFLSDVLMKTVMYSSYNLMLCSKTGVMSSILRHLKQRDLLGTESRGLVNNKVIVVVYRIQSLLFHPA